MFVEVITHSSFYFPWSPFFLFISWSSLQLVPFFSLLHKHTGGDKAVSAPQIQGEILIKNYQVRPPSLPPFLPPSLPPPTHHLPSLPPSLALPPPHHRTWSTTATSRSAPKTRPSRYVPLPPSLPSSFLCCYSLTSSSLPPSLLPLPLPRSSSTRAAATRGCPPRTAPCPALARTFSWRPTALPLARSGMNSRYAPCPPSLPPSLPPSPSYPAHRARHSDAHISLPTSQTFFFQPSYPSLPPSLPPSLRSVMAPAPSSATSLTTT